MPKVLVFDTETTGLPSNFGIEYQPHIVQIAWQLWDTDGKTRSRAPILLDEKVYIIKPDGYIIPEESVRIHHIHHRKAVRNGVPIMFMLTEFDKVKKQADMVVCHNMAFDMLMMNIEHHRVFNEFPEGTPYPFVNFNPKFKRTFGDGPFDDTKPCFCTMESTTYLCKIPPTDRMRARYPEKPYKPPKLSELYHHLFQREIPEEDLHDALSDTRNTWKCFNELLYRGLVGTLSPRKKQLVANDSSD